MTSTLYSECNQIHISTWYQNGISLQPRHGVLQSELICRIERKIEEVVNIRRKQADIWYLSSEYFSRSRNRRRSVARMQIYTLRISHFSLFLGLCVPVHCSVRTYTSFRSWLAFFLCCSVGQLSPTPVKRLMCVFFWIILIILFSKLSTQIQRYVILNAETNFKKIAVALIIIIRCWIFSVFWENKNIERDHPLREECLR